MSDTSGPAYEKFRVLVVDDNEFMIELVSSLLRQIGFRDIITAADGETALKKLMQSPPALIICDINMKPMDGFEFVGRLRSAGYVGKDKIPTLFLTAHAEEQYVKKAVQLQADGFLVKPVKKDVLIQRVQKVLYGQLAQRKV
ncbi:MAG: response regulator [Alphaproteobacteria bacterium]|nr:response regulator [Alphaproteobacteria bacterium]